MLNRINIIGAGVSGLFLGYCLKKNGFNPIIYEKDKSLSDNGAGVNLSRNATILLEEVGLLEKLSEFAYFPNKVNFRSFHNNSVIKSLQLNEDNFDFISIDRKDLISVLASEYTNLGGEIKFNHELEHVGSSKIFFKDNLSYDGGSSNYLLTNVITELNILVNKENEVSSMTIGFVKIK